MKRISVHADKVKKYSRDFQELLELIKETGVNPKEFAMRDLGEAKEYEDYWGDTYWAHPFNVGVMGALVNRGFVDIVGTRKVEFEEEVFVGYEYYDPDQNKITAEEYYKYDRNTRYYHCERKTITEKRMTEGSINLYGINYDTVEDAVRDYGQVLLESVA